MTKWLTQVWCLPGMTQARLTILADDENYHAATLDLAAVKATIAGLQEAERRIDAALAASGDTETEGT